MGDGTAPANDPMFRIRPRFLSAGQPCPVFRVVCVLLDHSWKDRICHLHRRFRINGHNICNLVQGCANEAGRYGMRPANIVDCTTQSAAWPLALHNASLTKRTNAERLQCVRKLRIFLSIGFYKGDDADLSFDIRFGPCNTIVGFVTRLATKKTYRFPEQPTSADHSTIGVDKS
jgi:hypothetical protein